MATPESPYTGPLDPHDSRTWGDWSGRPGEPFPFDGFVQEGRFLPAAQRPAADATSARRGRARAWWLLVGAAVLLVLVAVVLVST